MYNGLLCHEKILIFIASLSVDKYKLLLEKIMLHSQSGIRLREVVITDSGGASGNLDKSKRQVEEALIIIAVLV